MIKFAVMVFLMFDGYDRFVTTTNWREKSVRHDRNSARPVHFIPQRSITEQNASVKIILTNQIPGHRIYKRMRKRRALS